MRQTLPAVLALALLAACGPAPARVAVPPAPIEERVAIAYRSVEVLTVSLPAYAMADEVFVTAADGTLERLGGVLWADDPARAMTLDLTRALGTITGARIAAEPWPFDARPVARLDVRVSEMVAVPGQGFRLTGQYCVGAFDGWDRAVARPFASAVRLAEGAGIGAISAARAAATAELALQIAREGLR